MKYFLDINDLCGMNKDKIKYSSALFLLKLKEHYRLSQVAIDDIVEGFHRIMADILDYLQVSMVVKLAEFRVDEDKAIEIESILKLFAKPFDGLETLYQQEKYYVDKLHYLVSFRQTNRHTHVYNPPTH